MLRCDRVGLKGKSPSSVVHKPVELSRNSSEDGPLTGKPIQTTFPGSDSPTPFLPDNADSFEQQSQFDLLTDGPAS